jgi:hypothetical protein
MLPSPSKAVRTGRIVPPKFIFLEAMFSTFRSQPNNNRNNTWRPPDNMAQGAVKKTPKPNPGGKGGKSGGKQQAKKSGVSKTKKSKTTADKIQKKYTAGLVARTEQMLGERAGHLELIGKGRKKGAEKEFKGGSRKFG